MCEKIVVMCVPPVKNHTTGSLPVVRRLYLHKARIYDNPLLNAHRRVTLWIQPVRCMCSCLDPVIQFKPEKYLACTYGQHGVLRVFL
jgi:hypothetical protein